MRILTITIITVICINLVKSYPQNGFQSRNLDELMLYETENDSSLRDKRTIGLLRQLFPEVSQRVNPKVQESNKVEIVENNNNDQESVVAESSNNEVRVQFADDSSVSSNNDASSSSNDDGDLAPLDDIEDENRDKRNLGFDDPQPNGNGGNGGGSGSGAGSGNFLFDIIRQAADGAARAAGTVYRVVAGTQSLGLGLSASRDIGPVPSTNQPPGQDPMMMMPMMGPIMGAMMSSNQMMNGTGPPLVAGSGSGSSGGANDPAAGAPTPGPATEAVPGPVTRLFVIANRGISNLVQDLILRLAATSERIVNFKARLITSII